MMNEKRFTKCDTKIRDNGEEMTQSEVRDMLNKLNDENEQLKGEVKRLSHEQMCDADLIQQLRNSLYIDPYKEFIRYRNNFAEVCEELAEVNKEYGNLKEENDYLTRLVKAHQKSNEQLKQAYNDAKKDVEKKEQILKDIMEDNLLIQDIRKELRE